MAIWKGNFLPSEPDLSPPPGAPAAALAYCANQVRRNDPERYLTVMFAPEAARGGLHALYALNWELARVRESVSEPLLGQIRLQWWRDTLDEIYAGVPRRHEVALALAASGVAAARHRGLFDRLIDARERDLFDRPPATLAELEDYADATSGGLVRLALAAHGIADPVADAAGRQVGVAWALTGLLRALPFHAQARRHYMPADLMAAEGVDPAALYEGRPGRDLGSVVRNVAVLAETRLAEARSMQPALPRAALPALLLATLAGRHLARLRAAEFDPFVLASRPPPRFQAWRLFSARARGRF
ncbi:MAG: squalene/phytoene synthase family protein [Alphaproteobacteria bacterium]|nr:squalene/phytoene synthase family protein [Alphaproteobacteria bacterium]